MSDVIQPNVGHNVQRHVFLYILVQKLSKSEHYKLSNCLICMGYFFQNVGIVRHILVIQYNEFKNVHRGIKMSTVELLNGGHYVHRGQKFFASTVLGIHNDSNILVVHFWDIYMGYYR